MTALVPPAPREAAEPLRVVVDGSTGVSPTWAKPTKPPTSHSFSMHAEAPLLARPSSPFSRFASWRALESSADAWASYGALGIGMASATLLLVLL